MSVRVTRCSLPSSPSSSSLRHSRSGAAAGKVARIGFLSQGPAPSGPTFEAFRKGCATRLRFERPEHRHRVPMGGDRLDGFPTSRRNSSVSRWMSRGPVRRALAAKRSRGRSRSHGGGWRTQYGTGLVATLASRGKCHWAKQLFCGTRWETAAAPKEVLPGVSAWRSFGIQPIQSRRSL